MERFNELSEKAREIMNWFEMNLDYTELRFGITFKEPHHDIARRFLNEIVEFEPAEEVRRSSLKPWTVV